MTAETPPTWPALAIMHMCTDIEVVVSPNIAGNYTDLPGTASSGPRHSDIP